VRRALARALTLLAATAATAATAGAQRPFATARALDATAAVRVFSMAGSITVVGWAHDSIHVTGTVGAGLTPRAGGTRTAFKLTTYDGEQDARIPSHLEIRLPRRAQLWIKVGAADVAVRGVEGSVEVYTIDGRVVVAGAPTELTAETMRGAVQVTGAPGWLRARSGTGAVRFDGTAGDVALSTVSGSIACAGEFRRGRLESVRGDILLTSALTRAAAVDVDSHAGAVTLRLRGRPDAAFTVYSVSGAIANALTAERVRPSRGTGRELALVTGRGSTRVSVRTFSGRVTLQPAPAEASAATR
jgi:hypothetical protein